MSKFCKKHVGERTDQELKFMIENGPESKNKDNARAEVKRRIGLNRHWSKKPPVPSDVKQEG